MIIEKDKILGKWVVWYKEGNAKFEIFRAKTKKECVMHIQKEKKVK